MLRSSPARLSRRMSIVSAMIALSLVIGLLQLPAHAQTQATITFFEETLSADGDWLWHPTYGGVWRPRQIGPDWRPYMYGRWIYTSEYGWV